ncbi:AMP-binding enzyme domain-containing protein [Besnoitia besnoiti]|uniref:AMP-binding enzyme domain-containing protein n=1 Tax=Besnoitia besnoiti TaxID=94643 RepID=A0A2A9MQD7_BESBE|nr:AMP-binding enzyme domain-containing protein [Besnoitia besnoiti]PFH38202.1 AMP-binding enzyme domain-containing protein [Besnoitia besnoiti]
MSMSFCAEAAEGATSNGARVPPKEQWRGLYAVPVEGIPKKEGESAVYRCIESSDNPVPVTMLPGSLKGYPDVRSPFDALYCAALAFPDDPFLGEREKLLLVVPAPGADREAAAGADARTLSSASGSGAAAPSPPGNAGDKPGTPGTGKDSASGFRSTRSGESLSDSCGRNVPDAVSFGDYKWITYKETLEKTQALAWALSNEVEVPVSAFGEDADVQEIFRFAGIWARSSAAWRITDFACNAAKLVSVPLYDTLGHEALLYILGLTKLQVLFVEGAKLHPALRLATEDKVPLRTVICFDPVTPEEVEEFSAAQIKLYYLDELIEKGSGKPHERPALGLEDVYTVIFTSGTTGVPKGVVHTNGGFVATIAGYVESNNRMNLARGDTTISYLPQSHVYQRGVEVILTHIGVRIGYYSGEITRLIEDLQRLKPTVFFGVPRVYTRILDRIMSGVKEKSGLVQWLFRKALSWKENNYKKDGSRFSATVPDVLFGKVRATFGGQLKTLCMGSAPMKAEALVTLQMLLAAPVCEGWGMTETGICFLQEAADNEKGTIGGPFPSLEFKIVSRPDLAYSADGEVPRGELLVRGPSIMKRYFQDTESTEAALDEDGWMRTGDVVELLPSGAPRIIDRAKNIFKLAQGEYISPERLENIFACSPFVEQIYLHGDSVQNSLVAVVVPSKDAVLEWAKEQKKDKMPYSDLLNDPDLRRTVVLSIKEAGRGRVHSFEEPKSVFLTPFAFTPDNGLATPTMKVVRKAVEKEYRKQIDELYAKLQGKTP